MSIYPIVRIQLSFFYYHVTSFVFYQKQNLRAFIIILGVIMKAIQKWMDLSKNLWLFLWSIYFVVLTYIQASDFWCFKVSYWKPIFTICCKFLFFQWWMHHCGIMTSYWHHCDIITMNLSFFTLLSLLLYSPFSVFLIDISFYDVLLSKQKWRPLH